MIKIAKEDCEISNCFEVMNQLRSNLEEENFVPLVRELMREGYQLAYLTVDSKVVCVAGFKIQKNLFLDKNLYVEDLVSLETARSAGHGAKMISWLRNLAKSEGCTTLRLDSGVQRHKAHKFYFNQGMDIVCYHFAENIAQ